MNSNDSASSSSIGTSLRLRGMPGSGSVKRGGWKWKGVPTLPAKVRREAVRVALQQEPQQRGMAVGEALPAERVGREVSFEARAAAAEEPHPTRVVEQATL